MRDSGDENGFDYLGSLIYSVVDGERSLESASFGGGRIRGTGDVHYFLTDHLGSTRVVVNGSDGQIIEQNDYYAFGGRHETQGLPVSDNRFRFSGKEDQTTGDLPMQDFGARFYNPKVPGMLQIDPLSELNPRISPYAYCSGNPINRIDPDGKKDRRLGPDELPNNEHRASSVGKETSVSVTREQTKITVTRGRNENYGEVASGYTITGSGMNISNISNKSAEIVSASMKESGEKSVRVTSTVRTPEKQASIMYDNIQLVGVDAQRVLYGTGGNSVINTYETSSKQAGSTRESVVTDMTNTINTVGPQSVSLHCGDPTIINVIDIAPSSVNQVSIFQKNLQLNNQIQRVIPYPRDPAIHIEIRQ